MVVTSFRFGLPIICATYSTIAVVQGVSMAGVDEHGGGEEMTAIQATPATRPRSQRCTDQR
jgi:hypothetical protein